MSVIEDTTPRASVSSDRAVKTRRKLIEVALPLEPINEEGSKRKRKAPAGYITALHKWWAQRPLAAARAVIFGQMVDDPGEYTDELLADPATRERAVRELRVRREVWHERRANQEVAKATGDVVEADAGPEPALEECAADLERQRLFRLIEQLVTWENTSNEPLLEQARAEIRRSWRRTCADNRYHPRAAELFDPDRLPTFLDPFAGGGALPLEAQRLGLEAHASDINPVAVLINKAIVEIPPLFGGRPPVNPEARSRTGHSGTWKAAAGLADDVRYYGNWMRDEAERQIGHLYPPIEVTAEMAKDRPDLRPYVGREVAVVAWLWTRTVRSPNPAFSNVEVPLAATFLLSTKPGKEAYVEPVVADGGYRFTVRVGRPPGAASSSNGTKLARGANFVCLMSGSPITGDHIKAQGAAGRMGARLMAIVAQGDRGRIYLPPTPEHEAAARAAEPEWEPDTVLAPDPRALWTPPYGLRTFGDLFTNRQLVALGSFAALVAGVRERVRLDAIGAGLPDDPTPLRDLGEGATAYADAVGTYLAFAVDRCADYGSSLATWRPKDGAMRSTLAKQAIPMSWDFAEGSPFASSSSGFMECCEVVSAVLTKAVVGAESGFASQATAARSTAAGTAVLVSTDPPYYDNIGYADLSDFFYVWLRRSMRAVYPDLFATLAVIRDEELVATPYRHGGKEAAEAFFLDGMTEAMRHLAVISHPAFPITIYYAFKQAEADGADGIASTGWETFLGAVVRAHLAIDGTWPMRTEGDNRQVGLGANALASSIVLVCRPRAASAPAATREHRAR